jgi:hypothetical protein
MTGPQSFATLRDILQYSPEQLQEAIAEARDMFLRISPGMAGNGDLYDIGAATSLFVNEMSSQLDRFSSIQARVQHFNSQSKVTPSASFESAYTLGYRGYDMYIAWLNLERDNTTEITNRIAICERVLNSDGFDGRARATFRNRLARYQAIKLTKSNLRLPMRASP